MLIVTVCCNSTLVIVEPAPTKATIVRWIDGDTCVMQIDGGKQQWTEHVRIYGIDTPERGEEGFDEATQASRKEWPPGTLVTLTYPETKSDGSTRWRDSFGRLLAVFESIDKKGPKDE